MRICHIDLDRIELSVFERIIFLHYIYTYAYTYIHTYLPTYIHTYIHLFIIICVYIYMHLHLYIWADYSNILCCETNCMDSLPMFFLWLHRLHLISHYRLQTWLLTTFGLAWNTFITKNRLTFFCITQECAIVLFFLVLHRWLPCVAGDLRCAPRVRPKHESQRKKYIYIYINIYIYMNIYIYVYVYIYIWIYIYVYKYEYIYIYIYEYIYMNIYIFIYLNIFTYIYVKVLVSVGCYVWLLEGKPGKSHNIREWCWKPLFIDEYSFFFYYPI